MKVLLTNYQGDPFKTNFPGRGRSLRGDYRGGKDISLILCLVIDLHFNDKYNWGLM